MSINRTIEPECVSAKVQKRRPHPSLLRVISRKGKHPGRAHRIKRLDRYQVGMSLLHCRETAGLDHLDVLYYAKQGLLTLRDMTPEERRDALRRWDGKDPTRDVECTPSATREANAATHVPARDHERVEVPPEVQARTARRNTTSKELWGASRTVRLSSARSLTFQVSAPSDPRDPTCHSCRGSGQVEYVSLFGRGHQRVCGVCQGRGDLQNFYKVDPKEYAYWRGVYDRERRRGRPWQPRHLRQRTRHQESYLPILFRLLASVVRAVSRGTRD